VTTFNQIRDLFDNPDDTTFIDMSQLMSGRRIVGSKRFDADLKQQIIEPYILARRDDYIRRLAREIRSRHRAVDQGLISRMNVKETKGGLRDIELLLLCLEARCNLWMPVSLDLHEPLREKLPHRTADLIQLFQAFTYLKHRRDLYRLTVAAEDEMLPDETGQMARILGYGDEPEKTAGNQRMIDEYLATTARVEQVVLSFLDELGY
jgi:UTP:GlnB (protein PII) uridylyltransferase